MLAVGEADFGFGVVEGAHAGGGDVGGDGGDGGGGAVIVVAAGLYLEVDGGEDEGDVVVGNLVLLNQVDDVIA